MFPISGPNFLLVYLALFAAALLAHWLLRWTLRSRTGLADPPELLIDALSPEDVGYLLDGPARSRAAGSLAHREAGSLAHRDDRGQGPYSRPVDPENSLPRRGLVLSSRQLGTLRLWGAALFGGLLAAGVARIFIGLYRGKPVGLLTLIMIGVVFRLVTVMLTRFVRTRAGDALVAKLKLRYRQGLGDTSAAMGFALLGWMALGGDPSLQAHLRSQGYSSPSSGGCGTGGGGGCSGGGSGCSGGGSGCSGGGSGCSGGGGCGGCGGGS
jgi:hypothetical protein